MKELEILLSDFKGARITMKPNYQRIPVSRIGMDEIGAAQFNDIFFYLKKNFKNKIVRTEKGSISISKTKFPAYDVRVLPYCVELTILYYQMYRIQFRGKIKDMDQTNSGRQAFIVFKKCLSSKFNIDLENYAISDGKSIKDQIEIPLIKLEKNVYKDMTFNNVHHIDFHSSYPAGLAITHPELKQAIEYMYHQRDKYPIYKAVLDFSIGFMQSSFAGYRFTHLSRDAINNNNNRIRELANQLKKNNRVIIMYNTDGIWYSGDVYHGDGEGPELGQWHNDHVNCMFRAKSAGSYEFIENGVYTAKVRGRTKLDTIKPREMWSWGDIYRNDCIPIKWIFDEYRGVIEDEKEICD